MTVHLPVSLSAVQFGTSVFDPVAHFRKLPRASWFPFSQFVFDLPGASGKRTCYTQCHLEFDRWSGIFREDFAAPRRDGQIAVHAPENAETHIAVKSFTALLVYTATKNFFLTNVPQFSFPGARLQDIYFLFLSSLEILSSRSLYTVFPFFQLEIVQFLKNNVSSGHTFLPSMEPLPFIINSLLVNRAHPA